MRSLDVPGFTDILFHLGNDDSDTAGCLLVGRVAKLVGRYTIPESALAYEPFYKLVIDSVYAGECTLTIVDDDNPARRSKSGLPSQYLGCRTQWASPRRAGHTIGAGRQTVWEPVHAGGLDMRCKGCGVLMSPTAVVCWYCNTWVKKRHN